METFEKNFDVLNKQVNVTKFGFTVINVNTKIKLGVVSLKIIRNVQAVEIERNRKCIYSKQNWAQGRTLWDTTQHNANTRATFLLILIHSLRLHKQDENQFKTFTHRPSCFKVLINRICDAVSKAAVRSSNNKIAALRLSKTNRISLCNLVIAVSIE